MCVSNHPPTCTASHRWPGASVCSAAAPGSAAPKCRAPSPPVLHGCAANKTNCKSLSLSLSVCAPD